MQRNNYEECFAMHLSIYARSCLSGFRINGRMASDGNSGCRELFVQSIQVLIVLVFIVAGLSGRADAAGQVQVEPAALAVAQNYFDALKSGDRHTLLALLSGRERARSDAQLNKPDYSQFLIDRYRNARLEVIGGGVEDGFLSVDIAIWLNVSESVKERLILKPLDGTGSSLSIVAREELE